jgi:hypothetical protein
MKNKFLKYYIAAFYLCSTFAMFADPSADDTTGGLEGTAGDTTPAPIDDYVWVLAIIGLLFVFMKFRAIQKNKIQG